MSDIIIPGGKPNGFVQGRRLKRVDALEDYIGWVIVLRSPTNRARASVPMTPRTNTAGMFQTVILDPLYEKRAKAIAVLSPGGPGAFVGLPTEILEESDPWAFPAGFPEKAESLLEE